MSSKQGGSVSRWLRLGLTGIALGMGGLAASPGAAPAWGPQAAKPAGLDAKIDAIFATVYEKRVKLEPIRPTGPGCAVGVSLDGQVVIEKAYGMADLEHDIPNKPDTIFEIGSASKQFTAAAVLLLARDGKLSLDDPVRKYIPELPDYGRPVTIRQMLTHTSGLRGWDIIVRWTGWPRTTRLYTQEHVLEVVHRQRSLNFEPGTRFSYSNTNYNLAAILVSRVSGQSFAAFSRARIFEPLGMTRTAWRDDLTSIVKGRAVAYHARDPLHIRLLMPFENTVGPGGLLTTVGDLLKWNDNFERPRVGDAAFVAELQAPGRLTGGRAHEYAMGLIHFNYDGLREVSHSGGTAGYTSNLARFPDVHLSVAVLCNGSNPEPFYYTHAIADLFRPVKLKSPAPPVATHQLAPAEIEAVTGLYRGQTLVEWMRLVRDGETLRVESWSPAELVDGASGGGVLIPLSASRFVTASRSDYFGASNGFYTWDIDPRGTVRRTNPFGTVDLFERVAPSTPAAAELAAFAGRYESDEADAEIDFALKGQALVMTLQPGTLVARRGTTTLQPAHADTFLAPGFGIARFHRDAAGAVTGVTFGGQSVWNLRFTRK